MAVNKDCYGYYIIQTSNKIKLKHIEEQKIDPKMKTVQKQIIKLIKIVGKVEQLPSEDKIN